jgi:thiol-disulfide isomerase/thioredoxin
MKRSVLVLVVLGFTVAALVAASRLVRRDGVEPAAAPAQTQTEEPTAPVRLVKNPVTVGDISLKDLTGRSFSLSSLRGKVVLVNFWATWCGPCRAEIPALIGLQEKYRDQLVILGVSTDEASPEQVSAFAQRTFMNYPIVMVTNELRKAFPGVFALPTTFVLDPQGRIVQKHVGVIDISTYENETRVLTGLSHAKIEEVEDTGQVLLANAAHATEIPGVDLSGISAEKRQTLLARLNEDKCTCGCDLTLAQCRINDTDCKVSLPIARALVRKVKGA